VHRHNIYVASKYDGESDFATMEVVVQRAAEIKGQAATMLPRVQRLRRVRPSPDHVSSGTYQRVNG
jgi:ABC-type ATPase involved in cell division